MCTQWILNSACTSAQFGQSLLCPHKKNFAKLAIQNAPRGDSDQTTQMSRLIWIFPGRTCPKICFRTLWLITYYLKDFDRWQNYILIIFLWKLWSTVYANDLLGADLHEMTRGKSVFQNFVCRNFLILLLLTHLVTWHHLQKSETAPNHSGWAQNNMKIRSWSSSYDGNFSQSPSDKL